MIPSRFAIAMTDHSWILRNDLIWYKPNCMPSSAKDRFTIDYEHVFFFTKSKRYYFETQYEPMESQPHKPGNKKTMDKFDSHLSRDLDYMQCHPDRVWGNPLGRLKRCVWKIPTQPYKEAHFATFPEALIEPMVKSGCPQYICNQCGHQRKLVYEETRINTRPGLDVGNGKSGTDNDPNSALHNSDLSKHRQKIIRMPKFGGIKSNGYGRATYSGKEWNPVTRSQTPEMTSCDCDNAGWSYGTVLDPFCGAGTTGLVALKHARNFIGIEINPEYIKLAEKRLEPYAAQSRLTIQ
jgi:hypothetical protein